MDTPIAYLYEGEYLTLARLWIAQGDLAATVAARNRSLIEILILQALTFAAQKREEEASSVLEQALGLAEFLRYLGRSQICVYLKTARNLR